MKYFNNEVDSLSMYKLFEKFLSDEEIKTLGKGIIRVVANNYESVELNNKVLIDYYKSINSLYVVRNNSVDYIFDPITKSLRELMKFSLLSGDIEDFVKIILSRNRLINSIFDLFSSNVKSWITNKATSIRIYSLDNYRFTEKGKEGDRTVLVIRSESAELNVLIKDMDTCKAFTIKSTDIYSIAGHVNEFFLKRNYHEIH